MTLKRNKKTGYLWGHFMPNYPEYYNASNITIKFPYITLLNEKLGLYHVDNTELLDKIKVGYLNYLKQYQANNLDYSRIYELWDNVYYYMIVIRSNISCIDYIKLYVNINNSDYATPSAFICDFNDNELIQVEHINPNCGGTFFNNLTTDSDTLLHIGYISIILDVPHKCVTQYMTIIQIINHELTHCILNLHNPNITKNNTEMQNIVDIISSYYQLPDNDTLSYTMLSSLSKNKKLHIDQFGELLKTVLYYTDYSERAAFLHAIPEQLYSAVRKHFRTEHEQHILELLQNPKYLVNTALNDCGIYQLYNHIKTILTDIKNECISFDVPHNYTLDNFVNDYISKINIRQQCKDLDIVISKVESFDDILDIWIAACDCFIQKAIKIAMNFDKLNYAKYNSK